MKETAPSWAIIDLGAYAHNLNTVRTIIGSNTAIMAIVKANGYGHGLIPIATRALQTGVECLGVSTVEEGIELRQAGFDGPVCVLIQPAAEAFPAIIEYGLALTISDTKAAERLGALAHKANKIAAVHCKIDSGMGRQGFILETAVDQIQHLTRISHIDIAGIATHFPSADQPDNAFTQHQIKTFKRLLKQIDRAGIPYEDAHAANSAAIVNYPGSAFNMVRPGIISYGIWPSATPPASNPLRRVMHWETRITQVRTLEPGASVGYGRTYTTPGRMNAAVLPIGYADGYKHQLSNKADVLIRGRRCPVRGSVCMDQLVVDVTHLDNVQPGEVATLLGRDGNDAITAEELARHAGTIPYDILTGIGNRVPREYIG